MVSKPSTPPNLGGEEANPVDARDPPIRDNEADVHGVEQARKAEQRASADAVHVEEPTAMAIAETAHGTQHTGKAFIMTKGGGNADAEPLKAAKAKDGEDVLNGDKNDQAEQA